jgi:F0F1-type ATP synthase membrane subunit c/vacuolar-type H+-ATPase subunit K
MNNSWDEQAAVTKWEQRENLFRRITVVLLMFSIVALFAFVGGIVVTMNTMLP